MRCGRFLDGKVAGEDGMGMEWKQEGFEEREKALFSGVDAVRDEEEE